MCSRGRPRSDAPARPDTANATGIKRCRYALLRNPETLSCKQVIQLDWVVRTHPDFARAYSLKEGLRVIFKLPLDEEIEALEHVTGSTACHNRKSTWRTDLDRIFTSECSDRRACDRLWSRASPHCPIRLRADPPVFFMEPSRVLLPPIIKPGG